MISKRNNIQFRILYFIGIFLIVANHCGGGSISLFYEWFPAYSFHVALFVFCSGYFFIKNKEVNIITFLKKILFKFIIPLYFWNLIYGLIIMVLHYFGFKFGQNLSINSLLLLPIYNGHQFSFNLATWFIPPLIIVQLFNYFIIKPIHNNKMYIVHFFVSILLGFLGILLSIKGFNKDWGVLLCRTLYFIPFFSFGLLYKVLLEKYDTISNTIYFCILFFISFVLIFIFGGVKTYVPSWCANFDNFYRPFIVGLLGILFWLRISRILVPILKNNKIVNYISKNTFSIMTHHLMGFFILNTIWYFLSKIIKSIDSFNVDRFKSTIEFMYLPKSIVQFEILYVIFGIGFSLLVKFIVDKIIDLITKRFKKAKN